MVGVMLGAPDCEGIGLRRMDFGPLKSLDFYFFFFKQKEP